MTSFRKRLTQACNASPRGVSFWGEISTTNVEQIQVAQICHGSWRLYTKAKVYENISNHYRKKVPKRYRRHYREWISFVLNDSPWSKAFITKRFGVAVQHNIELRADIHPSIAMGGIIAMRMASEMPAIMPTYAKIRRMGYSVRTSFLVATLFDTDALEIMPHRALHSIWNSGCSLKAVFDFMNSGFRNTILGDLRKNCSFSVFQHSYRDECASLSENIAMLPSSGLVESLNAFGQKIYKPKLSDLKGIAHDIAAHYGGDHA